MIQVWTLANVAGLMQGLALDLLGARWLPGA